MCVVGHWFSVKFKVDLGLWCFNECFETIHLWFEAIYLGEMLKQRIFFCLEDKSFFSVILK